MLTTTVTSKGQVVIPASLRRKFRLQKGAKLGVSEEDGRIVMKVLEGDPIKVGRGMLTTRGTSFPIEIVAADQTMTLDAARFKARYRLAYADCFAAALAARKRAFLISGDPEFALIEKEVKLLWLPHAES